MAPFLLLLFCFNYTNFSIPLALHLAGFCQKKAYAAFLLAVRELDFFFFYHCQPEIVNHSPVCMVSTHLVL